jgi:hypothetical protein
MAYCSFREVLAGLDTRLDTPPSIDSHHPDSGLARDYETVRRVLGHRSIQTTIEFYCGLQTTQATEQFGNLIRQQIKFDPVD